MATFTNGTTWNTTAEITKQTGKFIITTANKYVDKNIELSFNIPGIVIPKATAANSPNQFYITVPNGASGTVTFTFTVDNNGNTTIT